ncbi:MAG: methylmalonyl-CoA epimerase [Chloroflexota bacterium]|nr:MAG: methylmalonyl-CoA epimerase [Chloroflexota bacterium]
MIKKVHHVAIAVKNMDEALKLYEDIFGIKPSKIETVPQQGVKAALLPMSEGGEIELLEPIDQESGVAKFIESRGEGIHHICLEVENVDQELCMLADKGVQLIDKQGRTGLAGKIGFLHPKSTKGVLIELVQKDIKEKG